MELLDLDTAAGHKPDLGPAHFRILSVERKFRALKIGAYLCQFVSMKPVASSFYRTVAEREPLSHMCWA